MQKIADAMPITLSSELSTEVVELSPKEKIEFGCELVELARENLSYPRNVLLSNPAMNELSDMGRKQLGRLGATLILIGVDESDWAA